MSFSPVSNIVGESDLSSLGSSESEFSDSSASPPVTDSEIQPGDKEPSAGDPPQRKRRKFASDASDSDEDAQLIESCLRSSSLLGLNHPKGALDIVMRSAAVSKTRLDGDVHSISLTAPSGGNTDPSSAAKASLSAALASLLPGLSNRREGNELFDTLEEVNRSELSRFYEESLSPEIRQRLSNSVYENVVAQSKPDWTRDQYSLMSTEEKDLYENYRRSLFDPSVTKQLLNHALPDTKLFDSAEKIIAGVLKLFLTELIELGFSMQARDKSEEKCLLPCYVEEAFRSMCEDGLYPGIPRARKLRFGRFQRRSLR